jgi:hypothetical protein
MEELNNPRHSYQTSSHGRCEGETFGVSWCLNRLPEDKWSPDGSGLSYSVHSHQSECSFIDIVFENIICPATVEIC